MSKLLDLEDVPKLIEDQDTLCVGGSGIWSVPDHLIEAVSAHYNEKGSPKDIKLISASALGSWEPGYGLDRMAHAELLGEVIAGHYGLMPEVKNLAEKNEFPAYCISQGVISQLYREIAADRPGLITKTGMDTFLDPRIGGGKMNRKAKQSHDVVRLVDIAGEKWIRYLPFSPDVTFIRGTYADEAGNISMEREANRCEMLPMAQATKNEDGIVVAQVKNIGKTGSLDPRSVTVPHILVDYIVPCENQTQSLVDGYQPSRTGELASSPGTTIEKKPLDIRKVIARRAILEIEPDDIVNLGVGISALVPTVAKEEGIEGSLNFTIEQGIIGGTPYDKHRFGAGQNPGSIISQPEQFDYYGGGGIDIAFLGFAQIDESGNVNVSKFGGNIMGVGGFIDITQSADRIVFCGTLTAGENDVEVTSEGPKIRSTGKHKKFVNEVEQVSFSHEVAERKDQQVLIVTEVGVFEISDGQVVLIEKAPGVNEEEDILSKMEFVPGRKNELMEMPRILYQDRPMAIDENLQSLPQSKSPDTIGTE